MNKTHDPKPGRVASGEMRPEYHLDYRKARPNRFSERANQGRLVVVLDPDIARVFTTPRSVNDILRALITTLPAPLKPKTLRKRAAARAV